MNKVVFLNTGHKSLDDRVFYHQAQCLLKEGFNIEIISTKEDFAEIIDSIKINSYNDRFFNQKQKINEIIKHLIDSKPEIIVADTPLAVIASAIYRKKNRTKIVYDITEWYPSKKNLIDNKGVRKVVKAITLTLLNLFAGLQSDYFIYGEHFKSIPFRILFFWKSYIYLPYYPNLNYIHYFPVEKIKDVVNLTFSGIINKEKGIESILNAISLASAKCPDKRFNLRIIGYFPTTKDRLFFEKKTTNLPENFSITLEDFLAFPDFCKTIGNTHIFLDLRQKDFENTYCLPIKLFYYLACGRPVLYTNLNSIQKAIPDINFGLLTNPDDSEKISNRIIDYINNNELYSAHAGNALKLAKEHFNWKLIENEFVDFIKAVRN